MEKSYKGLGISVFGRMRNGFAFQEAVWTLFSHRWAQMKHGWEAIALKTKRFYANCAKGRELKVSQRNVRQGNG